MIARNRARRELRPKLRLYCVEHIDAGRLFERAQQPFRRGLAWRYSEAELRVINEIAKRRWPDCIIGPPRPGDRRTPLERWQDFHFEWESHFYG
jgi:hypothetical protein